jgi:hypothetical protein
VEEVGIKALETGPEDRRHCSRRNERCIMINEVEDNNTQPMYFNTLYDYTKALHGF